MPFPDTFPLNKFTDINLGVFSNAPELLSENIYKEPPIFINVLKNESVNIFIIMGSTGQLLMVGF